MSSAYLNIEPHRLCITSPLDYSMSPPLQYVTHFLKSLTQHHAAMSDKLSENQTITTNT